MCGHGWWVASKCDIGSTSNAVEIAYKSLAAAVLKPRLRVAMAIVLIYRD